ncbi:MAG: excinuclease ABC subunit UvrA [Hyphomonas sp.]|uniref:excinuclease ABC subunit UvrA n=1 Tax=Hyphomonas sp. TaxID=87 RepID=UPI0018495514|nr:excinuclease ABC subunit UvrA [Hyphomonas sp.]MBA3067060.1 excinuclease ABC subunit UvrA [Hyphomonas sp.]MBU4063145.1 excinuclease ABC subunit UvrA [Alphaproteobacteria bacterium]MBU4164462.1 excinuclease ABC subunit UvrA [Alphaproteobacteria bacterium]
MAESPFIRVRGAKEHNLKNIDVDIPRGELVVMTGLSGSGKSSLAFDTIYAEGQRRYVESLSAYARQFLELMQKPDVESIEGLSPAISIEQKTTSRNPRSTVGTVTEIYDYMRLLWARVGVPYSPATGLPIESQTVSQMVDRTMELEDGTRLYLLAPIVRGRKGEFRKEFAELLKNGYQRVKVNGEFHELEDAPKLDKKFKHDIDVVVDRIVVKAGMEQRLAESFETALSLAQGIAIAEYADLAEGETEPKRITFSANFACPVSGFSIPEIEPRLFSFNNPFGACPSCDGLGEQLKIDVAMVVPDKDLGLLDGAIAPWAKSTSPYQTQTLQALAAHYKFDLTKPWNKLPETIQDIILFGTGDEEVQFIYDDGMRSYKTKKTFEGVIPNLDRRYRETDSAWVREEIARFQSAAPCPACGGKRLKPQALAVKIAGLDISQAGEFSIRKAGDWFGGVAKTLTKQQKEIAARILKEINDRLNFLNDVGLDYLSLGRASGTLSGGESQRIRLASQIGSGLTGVLYVLDEPSIGLHQRDNERLLQTLRRLRDLGNSVIVVEHDEDAILTADYVIDMGPAAGVHGGEIIAQGTPAEVMANPKSLTADYLNGTREIPIPKRRPVTKGSRSLVVKGASGNNLKNVTASIPLGTFTCITGVSGGGKSTLIIETLYKALARKLNGASDSPAPYESLDGLQHLDKVIDIDQSPIGRTPRSNPATYTGAFGPIRDWYAGLPESKARGYAPGRFSFNVKGGRCEACQGDGVIKIEMHFLPDVYVTCETCKGKRYNRETLEVLFKGKSIADVLDMTVEDGAKFFAAVPAIAGKLDTLNQVGLGYVKVGQQATTLSGGEAQRVKLAKELSKRATGRTLYILDEPTTGLHFDDVKKLLEVLHELVDAGNTVVVIEHNLDVVKTADWVLDLGPEGGDGGGKLIASGTPEDIAAIPQSHTGRFLAETFRRQDERRAQRSKRQKAAAKAAPAPDEKAKKPAKKSKAGAGAK